MKKKINLVLLATLAIFGTWGTQAQAKGKSEKEIKLTTLTSELIVNVTPEEAWKVINSYGDVGSYHSSIVSSKSLNGSPNTGAMNCERQCTIENGKKDIIVDEKIIKFVPGKYYTYEAHSEQFPAKAFFNTFGVKVNAQNQTVIYVKTEYRLKPGFLTTLTKGKFSKGNDKALLAYKHYMETGEKNTPPDAIEAKYNKS